MDDWVFVDTCIWASFFTKPGSPQKAAVDKLLDADRVALAGPLVAEVLLGFRRKDQADWVASRLRSAHYVEVGWDDWRAAADLGRDLAALGHKLPLTDLVIAAVARRCQIWVYSSDPHFDLIPGLKRHRPEDE
jgi:predicted nucleic acid-binding protein